MENPHPGELFERTFLCTTTDRLVQSLRRAYETACELHAPERGSNEVTFGFNLYHHAVHELCNEADRSPSVLNIVSRNPIFRMQIAAYELACHRVGLSERENIWTSFPKNEGAAGLMVEEQLWLPGLEPAASIEKARKLILAHLGNTDEGMRAVYLCVPGRTDNGRITGWVFARPLFRADEDKAAVERPLEQQHLLPEVEVDAPVVTRKPKPDTGDGARMRRPGDPIVPLGSSDLHLATHLFHPPRLTLARELRGLTKAELAERIGKSAAALSQFEGGVKATCKPDPKTLGLLALALGVPVGFFARKTPDKPLSVDACHFRSLRSASQRARRKLLARGALLCDLLDGLEEHVNLPVEQVSRVARTVHTVDEIEEYAVQVRASWKLGLGPIGNVVTLLESRGVLVTHIPEDCEDVDAFSTWHAGRPLVFLVMAKGSTSRSRFDACHELGHLTMHADVTAGSPELERQANRFASAFLLPKEPFLVECPRWLDWDHFYELKRRWKVSVAALVKRAYDLKKLSEASYRRAYVHLNKTGERLQERDEPPAEPPTLLVKALDAVGPEMTVEDVATQMGVGLGDLRGLLG